MAITFSTTLAACALALAAAALCAAPTASASGQQTQDHPHPKASKVLKAGKTGKAGKATPPAPHPATPEEAEPDITDTITVDYNCELGNKVTIFTNETDADHIAIRWKKRLHRLTRVGTSTGASRFENTAFGLVWIGIPAKSMLLDSKLNRQLANECKNAEQVKPAAAAKPGLKES